MDGHSARTQSKTIKGVASGDSRELMAVDEDARIRDIDEIHLPFLLLSQRVYYDFRAETFFRLAGIALRTDPA